MSLTLDTEITDFVASVRGICESVPTADGWSPTAPADAVRGSWVMHAPAFARPYLQLSRYDRPAGFWLLGLPCLIGLALARSLAEAEGEIRGSSPDG